MARTHARIRSETRDGHSRRSDHGDGVRGCEGEDQLGLKVVMSRVGVGVRGFGREISIRIPELGNKYVRDMEIWLIIFTYRTGQTLV